MGCDGGVLAMQRKYMRGLGHKLNDKASDEITRRLRALIRSRCCAVSNEQLQDPIVVCELGNLYNKEAVLTCLLERTLNPAFQHIRGTKDLIDCRFTLNPNYKEDSVDASANESKGETASTAAAAVAQIDEDVIPKYICPVTRLEMNAKQPFVVVRTTGWVLSDRAIREIGIPNLQEEYGPFTADDVIRLVPEDDEEVALRTKMLDRRAKVKKEKKRKREEGADGKDGEGGGEGAKESVEEKTSRKAEKKAAKAATKVAASKSEAIGKNFVMGLKVDTLADEAKKAVAASMASSSAYSSLFTKGEESTDKKRLLSVGRWR